MSGLRQRGTDGTAESIEGSDLVEVEVPEIGALRHPVMRER